MPESFLEKGFAERGERPIRSKKGKRRQMSGERGTASSNAGGGSVPS